MEDLAKSIVWEKTGNMNELTKHFKPLSSDRGKVEVGRTWDGISGYTTRVLVEVQRKIGGEVYFFSKVFHPKDVLSGDTPVQFKAEAAEFFSKCSSFAPNTLQ